MEKEKLTNLIKNNSDLKANICFILLETKPYRKQVFRQIYSIDKKETKENLKWWNRAKFEDKKEWINNIFIEFYEEEYLINHLITVISTLKVSKTHRQAFDDVLFMYDDTKQIKDNQDE